MKKVIAFIIAILFFIPTSVSAIETTKRLYINIDILENGDIFVRELAELDGEYNGRIRNIEYKNKSLKSFTGKKEDFYGSSIYNGTNITNLKIGDISLNNGFSFSLMDEVNNFYTEVTSVNTNYKVYTKTITSDGIDLKIYNPSTTNTAFYMEYIIKDVIVSHLDVSEFAFNILGNTYEENIDDLKVIVNLPESDNSMRVWAHGPLNGNIERLNDKSVKLTYDFLGAYNAIDIRIMFSNDIVNPVKKTNTNAKNYILEIEEELAKEANSERNKIKLLTNTYKGFTIIWFLGLISIVIYTYIKYDKEHDVDFNHEYYRDFPSDYGPEILEYLLKKNVTKESFSASIVEIIRKKALVVEDYKKDKRKKDYTLKTNQEFVKYLTKQELIIHDLLINTIGNKQEVTLNQIKNYGKKADKAEEFMSKYKDWIDIVRNEAKNEKFFYNLTVNKLLPCIYSLIGILLFYLNIKFTINFFLGYILLPLSIISTIYFLSFKKRTEKGALQYKKWMALKRFLKDFSRMDEKELPEVKIWEKYLVYAMVLGCAKQLEKDMKIKLEAINSDQTTNYYDLSDIYVMNMIFNSNLTSSINDTINQAIASSNSSIAASRSSSSNGFGGGVSTGGGSFGGGSGGGRF